MKLFIQSGLLLLFIFVLGVSAFCQDAPTHPADYLLATNASFSVHKQLSFSHAPAKDSAFAQLDYVNDFENIYTESETQFLSMLIADFEKETSIKIVLITFDSSMIEKENQKESAFSFPENINQEDAETDKVFVEISISQRMMQIESNVDMNRLISPHESKKIISNSFVPYFKKKQVFEGSLNGLKTLMKELKSKHTALNSSIK
jgi:uncharacterized protein